MKKLLIGLLALSSIQAFAGYKCNATKWRQGIGDTYYSLTVFPKSFKVGDDQLNGYIRGFDLMSERVSFGNVEYVFNGKISCIVNHCSLTGNVTEIIHGSNGNSGVSDRFSVYINGEDYQLIPMVEEKFLKIKCKNI